MARSPDGEMTRCLAAFLRHYGYDIDQKLGAGDDYLVPRCYAVEDDRVVADDLAGLERLVVAHVSHLLVRLSHESEIDSADSRHGYDRNNGLVLTAPDYTGADELGGAEAVIRVRDQRFGEHGLRRVVHLWRDERDATAGERPSVGSADLHAKIHPTPTRPLYGNIYLSLEP